MNSPFETLVRTALTDVADEASPVDLTSRALGLARRRRRTAAITLAAAAVAAVLVGAPLAITAADRDTPPAAVTSSAPAPAPSASPADRGEQLLAAVRGAITREAPQVTGLETLVRYMDVCELVTSASGKLMPKDGLISQAPYEASAVPQACPPPWGNDPHSYRWLGRFAKNGKVYAVTIHIYPTVHHDPADPPVNETDARERELAAQGENPPYRGPHGEHVLVHDYLLNMTKPGGIGVLIECHDTDETGAFMTRSPFTRTELAAIGLDPALRP
ncbi:hypothetical protein [Catellatospora chokoriensis]|uniref:Uncharacterized protein n=1 Tax=Catellatospora chokoriensis TaxID=310353 RepID=A0A8J3NRK0_9ACTN|nr:hypothetical protein [Catellatospora chokoriensis]GIF90025.1 hypothetical protein Cch02nite_34690 [Catellatospora chokoriensis]